MRRLTLLGIAGGVCLGALLALAQPVGETFVAGDTWYDLQHIGSCGRSIGVDDAGRAHVVWTRGTADGSRHVWYNVWDPDGGDFIGDEWGPLDDAPRAGFVTLAMNADGCPVFAYHYSGYSPSSAFHAVVQSCDGDTSEPAWLWSGGYAYQMGWPLVARDVDGRVHLLSFAYDEWNEAAFTFYSRGIPTEDPADLEWNEFYRESDFQPLDTTRSRGADIAASPVSSKIVRAWISPYPNIWESMFGNYDVMLQTSMDGGESWTAPWNVTGFVQPGPCPPDSIGWICCDRDTLRATEDLSVLLDGVDAIHAVFTTGGFKLWGQPNDCALHRVRFPGMIWHWSESTGQFSLVADGRGIDSIGDEWDLIVQQPSLALDPASGYLYCAYMRFDTTTRTTDGYLGADIFVSVSTDNGQRWSVGTNISRTSPSGPHPVPLEESLHERDHTLADRVSDGMLHLTYVLDREAGSSPRDEGISTLNPVIYQRIPVDSIPTTPLLPNYPLHYDSTGLYPSAVERETRPAPQTHVLYSAYPNPFNSATVFRFELPARLDIELGIYDILGRQVAVLHKGPLTAGSHELTWQPGKVASGVYLAALKSPLGTQIQKVVLLR